MMSAPTRVNAALTAIASPPDTLPQPLILRGSLPASINAVLERVRAGCLDDWRLADRIQREIATSAGKMDENVADQVGLVEGRTNDTVTGRLEYATGEELESVGRVHHDGSWDVPDILPLVVFGQNLKGRDGLGV